jgi:hypothetical protein
MLAATRMPAWYKVMSTQVGALAEPHGPSYPDAPSEGGWFRQITAYTRPTNPPNVPLVGQVGFSTYGSAEAAKAGLDAIRAQFATESIVGPTATSKTYLNTFAYPEDGKTTLASYSYVLAGTSLEQGHCLVSVGYPAKRAEVRQVVRCSMDAAEAQARKLG